jgi:tRNA-binding protein
MSTIPVLPRPGDVHHSAAVHKGVPFCSRNRLLMVSPPTISDLEALDLRIGTVVRCELNAKARKAALALWIDFGGQGVKRSSAQIADLYEPDALIGSQVVAVTGFAPMNVGGFVSEVLVVGALTDDGVVLLRPDRPVGDGSNIA